MHVSFYTHLSRDATLPLISFYPLERESERGISFL